MFITSYNIILKTESFLTCLNPRDVINIYQEIFTSTQSLCHRSNVQDTSSISTIINFDCNFAHGKCSRNPRSHSIYVSLSFWYYEKLAPFEQVNFPYFKSVFNLFCQNIHFPKYLLYSILLVTKWNHAIISLEFMALRKCWFNGTLNSMLCHKAIVIVPLLLFYFSVI